MQFPASLFDKVSFNSASFLAVQQKKGSSFMQKFFLCRRLRISALSIAAAGALFFAGFLAPRPSFAQSPTPLDEPTHKLAHDIFQQLIEINTTDSVGNVTTAAKAMQQRLLDAGFPKEDMYL